METVWRGFSVRAVYSAYWKKSERCRSLTISRKSWRIRTATRQFMPESWGRRLRRRPACIFTPELMDRLRAKGVNFGYVTLHVGLGTFRPVKAEEITDHHMHAEHYDLPQETAALIHRTKAAGKRVIAVGTTSCRTLESVAAFHDGKITAAEGYTDIFIYPGYRFQVLDGLITNFHLPESTLIMLVSAFMGYEHTMEAYRIAVEEKYRFYSFGDAMLIL